MYSLEEIIKNTPDMELDSEVAEFLTWLDTSDHWGWDLLGTMHHKMEKTFPPQLEKIKDDPKKLAIYNKLKELSYNELDVILVNWIGKEEILRSLGGWY